MVYSRLAPWTTAIAGATEASRAEEFEALVPLRPTIAKVLVSDPDVRVRREALRAFVISDQGNRTIPPAASPAQDTVEVLIDRFDNDPDSAIRAMAVGTLAASFTQSQASTRVFIEALSDPHQGVSAEAIGHLTPLLEDPNPQVRMQTVIVLAKFGPLAAPHLDALRAVIAREPNQELREQMESLLRTLQ